MVIGVEKSSDDLGDPKQHFSEAEQFQEDLRLVAPLRLGQFEMQPHPDIAKDQRDAYEEQSLDPGRGAV